MRAILVSVDYADLLAITLSYNRHHFDEVMVVTTPQEQATVELARAYNAQVYTTDSFYTDGADFNKWRALEEALDVYGRHGWMCIMDADILWPKQTTLPELRVGNLYGCLRYMMTNLQQPIPPEAQWSQFGIHRNVHEWAGYTQVFHCDDPHLGSTPWHDTNWRHAGGADSFFQFKWPKPNKIRLPFKVLHLGPGGSNWCGRASPYLDGTMPSDAQARRQRVRQYINGRDRRKGPYAYYPHERLRSET